MCAIARPAQKTIYSSWLQEITTGLALSKQGRVEQVLSTLGRGK
jgi:hypothetical protein